MQNQGGRIVFRIKATPEVAANWPGGAAKNESGLDS
jgi:hypothetical protein